MGPIGDGESVAVQEDALKEPQKRREGEREQGSWCQVVF